MSETYIDDERYAESRHELARRLFGDAEDRESVFIPFIEDARSRRFAGCLENVAKEGREKQKLVDWFGTNLRRFISLRNYPSLSEMYVSRALLAKLFLELIYLRVEELEGLDDKSISRMLGIAVYKESRLWREEVEKEESSLDMLRYLPGIAPDKELKHRKEMIGQMRYSLAESKTLVAVSERIFTMVKDKKPGDVARDIDDFLMRTERKAKRYRALAGKDRLTRGERLEYAGLLVEMFRLEDAKEILKGMEEKNLKDGCQKELHNQLGYIAMKEGDMEGARDLFRAALGLDPGDAVASFRLGTIYMEQGFLGFSYYLIEKASKGKLGPELKGEAAVILDHLGRMIRDRIKDRPDLDLERYVETERKYAQGLQLIQEQRMEEALSILREALELDPENARIMTQLALCHILEADFDEGQRLLKEAVAKNPKYVPANRNLAVLDQVREEYEKDPQYLEKLRDNLIKGHFAVED